MYSEEGDREQLARLVQQWNENRLDLFHLSYPTQELEIEGVMRFYFQDGGERVLTKCVRVSSTATTRAVIEALADKFLPDLKMLTDNRYTLWEVHENGTERRLDDDEKPLLVQLNWHRDDREGRFLLRRENPNFTPLSTIQLPQDGQLPKGARYSKRDKKENKKKAKDIVTVNEGREEPAHIGDLYRQVPQNTFTRTISNPETVMKRKRERKVEEKLKQIQHGGRLKIYGGDVVPSRPYVTILVSSSDRAEKILAEVVEKYGLDNSKGDFVLVEHPLPGGRGPLPPEGRIVHPHEFPLHTMTFTENGPDSYLALRRTPSEYASATVVNGNGLHYVQPSPAFGMACTDPAFLVTQPDGQVSNPPQWVTIRQGVTEVGSDRALAQYSQQAQNIYIDGPGVCGRHCVITFMERVVTITPSAPDARIEINGNRIVQTQILQHGDVVVIGRTAVFKFSCDRTVPEETPAANYSRLTPLCNNPRNYVSIKCLFSFSSLSDLASQDGQPWSGLFAQALFPIDNSDCGHRLIASKELPAQSDIQTALIIAPLPFFKTRVQMRRFASSQQLADPSSRYVDSSQVLASPHFFRKRGESLKMPENNNTPQYSTLPTFSSDQLKKLLSASSSSRQSSEQMEPRMAPKVANGYTSLPISLQIGDYKVWDYLVEVMSRGFTDATQFRLAPAYALYLALKFFHSHSKPYLVQFCKRIDQYLGQIASECTNKDELLFWLANSSEFFFLVDHNPDLRLPRSGNLSTMVESVFRRLCTVLVGALRPVSQPLLDIYIQNDVATNDLLNLLNTALRTARASRLNAALTIQVSGHMFHAINAALFNSLVGVGTTPVTLTTRLGNVLLQRLEDIYRWAEQMGVELAAECHLDRIKQTAILLAAQKNDVAALGATCYKLNSLQIRYLLSRFHTENGEIPCDSDVIGRIVGLAERQADQLTIQDGLAVTLEEADNLSLPFMLAIDGYVAENLRSVPPGLAEYLFALEDKGLCNSVKPNDQSPQSTQALSMPQPMQRSASQSTLTSLPTTQFGDSFGSNGDDIVRVTLKRGSGGIGLSIVAAQGFGDRQTGIYVKKVVENSPASRDGRLSRGDQLLSVNGQSLLAITQEEAALLMQRSGPEVRFEVKKGAANRNGLYQWFDGEKPTGVAAPNNIHPGMSQSLHSTLDTASMNYSSVSKATDYRPSPVQPPAYQQRQQSLQSRGSAFVPPANELTRHARSISASELYQNDPNSTMSQRSIAGSTAGFDRLPAHYRQSNRPTVVQPSRVTCPSPTALRRTAPSPGLYRPPSATNLFAPPKASNPLQQAGYISSSHRVSQLDIHRASTAAVPPQAQSSPIMAPEMSASLPAPLTHNSHLPNYTSLPRQPVRVEATRPSERPVSVSMNGYRQEPAVARPTELERPEERRTIAPPKGAVPTAITQALAIQAAQAGGAPSRVARPTSRPQMEESNDIRELEQRTQSMMTRESVEEELDRLDAKGINMTEEETRRYRELLNVAAEQSRQRVTVQPAVAIVSQGRRTETLIDDVQPGSSIPLSPTTPTRSQPQVRNIPVQLNDSPVSPDVESPGIIGAHEVYRDPRQRRLNEMDKRTPVGPDGARLDFRDKMRLFATQLGESTPKQRNHASSAERHIAEGRE